MDEGEGTMNLSTTESTVDLTGEVHQVPCCIKFDGSTSVSQYFKPKPTGTLKVKEAYFRGRKLQGATVPLPHAYSGFVLGKKSVNKRKASGVSQHCWETSATFKDITFWNHDSLPSQDDAVLRTFHWFPVAKALHKLATSEDLIAASSALEKC